MPVAPFVVIAVISLVTAVITWHGSAPADSPDRQAVAERASQIVTAIIGATPPTRDDTLVKLRPMVVYGLADIIKAEVLDHASEHTTPPVVRAVGVQSITKDSAQVIVVVERNPPAAGDGVVSDQPDNLVLVPGTRHRHLFNWLLWLSTVGSSRQSDT